MKIITWNINRAAYTRMNFWDYFNRLAFDVGLFQEVYMIPYKIRKNYHIVRGEMNAILLKKNPNMKKIEEESISYNTSEIDIIADFYVSVKIELNKKKIVFISVYNYIGPSEDEFSKFLDVMLSYIRNNRRHKIIIIGGDFNMDERFRGKYRGWGLLAEKMKKELYQLGYNEILSLKFGSKAFTFISPANKEPYQLDYLFIPRDIKINEIKVGSKDEIFNQKPRLSDHLPIIARIEL
nr:hypothetical protein [Candidatus Freyrarchaeum guaymaensis]